MPLLTTGAGVFSSASHQVLFDAQGSGTSTSGTIVTTVNDDLMTVGSGLTGGVLLYFLLFADGTDGSSPSANWDASGTPQAMTVLGSGISSTAKLYILGLRNPTAGNKRCTLSWTTSATPRVFGISFQGVNVTNDGTAFQSFTTATNAAPIAATVTSAVGDIVVGAYLSLINFTSVTDTPITALGASGINNSFGLWAAAANYGAGASPNKTISANPGSATTSVSAAINLKAS